eukprot:CAMPEP_0119346798 /NCGR_PEP_ID=MMETSP1333-20130426/108191_1 /TAXON_ID=418940 /ORGANISM="Scyphosphaera apsteinii, Strain RCC1455" /LENGTH=452 /DNA_ID=CAMNT_0007359317 /DNA_START=187 /DNA_END=1545 /DNA_ORIENTATION=-
MQAAAPPARKPDELNELNELIAAVPATNSGIDIGPAIVNLAKNIVGSGVLALAGGVAAFSGSPIALLPAITILLFLGMCSGYSFAIIARVGEAVGADTYRDTWTKVFGERTALLPSVTVVFKTLVGGLCYAIILGDMAASISKLAGAPSLLLRPNVWIFIVSALILLPLCLLRDLSSLAFGSVVGTAGTLYTALFMALRGVDGSYRIGGKFHGAIAAASQPNFVAASAAAPVLNLRIFVLVSMLATAFLAHYNAPKMYQDLAPPPDGSPKLPRFNLVVAGAFGLAALLCGSIMAGGFLTFGAASQGLILNNYATSDKLAFLARLGIGLSIIFSYPLNFVGLRDGVLGLFGWRKLAERRTDVHVLATLALMIGVNGAAFFLKDLGLVVAFGGAILGSALVYIFPALMFIGYQHSLPTEKRAKGELALNYGLAGLGGFLGVVGAFMSLKKAGVI